MIATMSRETKTVKLQTMVTQAEAERTYKLAEKAGMTVSDYLRACLMQDAIASLDKGAMVQLTSEITKQVLAKMPSYRVTSAG